jgi:predicted NACHT family NTPase
MIDPLIIPSAVPLIHKVAGELVGPTKGIATRTIEKLQVRFRKGFEAYIGKQLSRASTVKTIISSNAPIPLQDIYVNLFLASGDTAARDEDFLKYIDRYRAVVFTATAGAGKSMLMRYLYIRFLETQRDRLPIFIELRDLNQNSKLTIMSLIASRIADYIEGFSDQQLRYAFEQGKLLLFLDGFDEIDHDVRKDRERELNQIAARYDRLQIFVSSRPAEGFANWEKFHVFNVQPFTEKQVELLLSKIPYDQEIKDLFNKKLKEGLYRTHNEFLTNPLLTIMMLVTLEQFAEVPAKIHLFYEYAFEALFGRHDVTKGGFQRKRHTSLALDDFKRLFSYLCTITYIKKSLSFSSDVLLGYIQQSINSSQIQVDKSLFKNDLTESTCMLVLDGLDYTFSHRSFQEYFAAYFLARVKVDEIERVVPKLVEISGPFDNVLKMLAEMNSEKFEEAWSLQALQQLVKWYDGIDANQR